MFFLSSGPSSHVQWLTTTSSKPLIEQRSSDLASASSVSERCQRLPSVSELTSWSLLLATVHRVALLLLSCVALGTLSSLF